MAETVGSLADKISIIELKIYHMREQSERKDITEEFRTQCLGRLEIMQMQRNDLGEELSELIRGIASGRVVPKVYRQFKMYNDPKYRAK